MQFPDVMRLCTDDLPNVPKGTVGAILSSYEDEHGDWAHLVEFGEEEDLMMVSVAEEYLELVEAHPDSHKEYDLFRYEAPQPKQVSFWEKINSFLLEGKDRRRKS